MSRNFGLQMKPAFIGVSESCPRFIRNLSIGLGIAAAVLFVRGWV